MTRSNPRDFTENLFTLLKETFEDGGNFYLTKDSGLFRTLETITPEAASREPFPGAPTIAAHCAHLDYYVRANHNSIIGRQQELDWTSSWQVHRLGAEEWAALRARLRNGYDDLRKSLSSLPAWEDDSICDSMAVLAHTAYHLGAIRQIQRLLEVDPASGL